MKKYKQINNGYRLTPLYDQIYKIYSIQVELSVWNEIWYLLCSKNLDILINPLRDQLMEYDYDNLNCRNIK
jgi:hypothetical protein